MNLEQLKEYLNNLISSLSIKDKKILKARLKSLTSAFPFNEYEYILMFLQDRKIISFQDYEILRKNYVSSNRYLELYTLAPRIFGEIWAHQHIMDLDHRFIKPDKNIDSNYEGQYDLWIEGIKVEIKSARAINTKKRGNLVAKALPFGTKEPFWMNYQQIKLDVADVFVFIGVWIDRIIYWVLSNKEVKQNPYLSHQHRGGIEYQIGITNKNLNNFNKFKVNPKQLGDLVIKKGKKTSS